MPVSFADRSGTATIHSSPTPVHTIDDDSIRASERATRVQTFGRDNAADITPGSRIAILLTALDPIAAKPIAYEIAGNFVQDLRADRDALDACNAAKHSDNQEGVESTTAIDTLLAQAKAIVTRLDAGFLNKYKSNPDKIAAWKSASRVERAPR